tara:strand:+ start:474 stop:677 length:204 start_codon:yes stop_codon:yes gene_type:complete
MSEKEDLLGQKVQFAHHGGITRGTIVEVDNKTFVIATLLDETIRFRMPYSFLKDSKVCFSVLKKGIK